MYRSLRDSLAALVGYAVAELIVRSLMNTVTKVVARAAILNFGVALFMIYWAWGLFPSMATRLFGYVLFVTGLLPVSSIAVLAIRWSSARWQNPVSLMIIGMSVGALACYLEVGLLHLCFSKTFGAPSLQDIMPGLILGFVIYFGGIGRKESIGAT